MNYSNELDKHYRNLAWGAFFILVGSLSIIPGDQTSLAILAAGLILLALNLARSLSSIPMHGFTIALGAAAFVAGAMGVFRAQLGIQFEIQLIPIALIAVGLYFLWPQRSARDGSGS
jgi:hypothetical protein